MKARTPHGGSENDHIARLFLLGISGALAAATGYVVFNYGVGLAAVILATLTGLAYWGLVSASPRVRGLVAKLFSL